MSDPQQTNFIDVEQDAAQTVNSLGRKAANSESFSYTYD